MSEAAHWVERAEALIPPLLHAAAATGLALTWVLRWVLRADLDEPLGTPGGRAVPSDGYGPSRWPGGRRGHGT